MPVDILHDPIARYYIAAALVAVPLARIYVRAGFRPYGVALLLVPEAGLILAAAVLALCKWPALKKGAAK